MGAVHLINPMLNANGGAEWRTRELQRLLSRHEPTTIWSELELQDWHRDIGVRRIEPWRMRFPRSGVLVFVGAYFWVGNWIRMCRPRKVVVIVNTPTVEVVQAFLNRLRTMLGRQEDQLYFASEWLARRMGHAPRTMPSPIDIDRFHPSKRGKPFGESPFTVGRLSRDVAEKHHEDDPALYRELARRGFRVRILGGTCLASKMAGDTRNIELLPEGHEAADSFLSTLDALVYRTSVDYVEPHGRIVQEAMATGIPVCCGPSGGFTEYVVEGEHGHIFRTNQEAIERLEALRADPGLCAAYGRNARTHVETLFSHAACRSWLEPILN
jgi:glycosyltransferase involved in cell wall biosynthesis